MGDGIRRIALCLALTHERDAAIIGGELVDPAFAINLTPVDTSAQANDLIEEHNARVHGTDAAPPDAVILGHAGPDGIPGRDIIFGQEPGYPASVPIQHESSRPQGHQPLHHRTTHK